MPTFKKGSALIKEKASGGGGGGGVRATDFVPFMGLADGDEVFCQIFTDIEDVVLAKVHRFVQVQFKNQEGELIGGPGSKPQYRDFTCHKMDGWDGDGTCVLCDKLDHEPKENFAAVAVLLEPVFDPSAKTQRLTDIQSFNVKGRSYDREDGTTVFYPEVQIIFQASQNFWLKFQSHHEQIGPITANPWKIIRDGKDTGTVYNSFEVDKAEPVDWTGIEVPTIETVLETLGSDERYEMYLGDEDLWLPQKQRFRKDKKDSGGGVRKKAQDEPNESQAEEDGETAFQRIRKAAEARDSK